jgi:glycosyltransferase involved in cell wall biosynthesis
MSMRVLFISPVGELGGAERCLLTMIRALRDIDADVEPHLLACAEGPLLDEARQAGARIHCVPLPAALAEMGTGGLGATATFARRAFRAWPHGRDYLRRFRSALERISPDIIHSNGVKTHLLTGWLGRIEPPILWHIHDLLGHRALIPRLLRAGSAEIAGAIAISEAVATDARQVLPGLPVDVILNAVDTRHFAPRPGDGAMLDALAYLPVASAGALRVGLIATYARWKGHDLFLDAAARIVKQSADTNVRFYIIGGPIYRTGGSQFTREELEARAGMMGLASHVGFIDFQKDTAPIYNALDVVVHASTNPEPFGLTIAEAMACGRPVIATEAGGAAELFTSGRDGIGVRPRDSAGLAAAIDRLRQDSALRHSLGLHARQTAEARFNPTRLGRQLLDLYHRHFR